MEAQQNIGPCKFNILFTKYVPHILEKRCLYVNSAWKKLLTSESFQKKGKSLFHAEIAKDEENLWQAAWEGNVRQVKNSLLSIFVDVNCGRGEYLTTPLCEAAKNGHTEVVIVLLKRGADPNKVNKYGQSPMHFATKPHMCYNGLIF